MKIKNPETGEVIVIPQGMEDAVRDAIESGNDPMEAMQMKYGGIHINPANKGKFNATKKATGKTTEELTHSKNPLTRKRAIFAQNASRWKHQDGGQAMQQQQQQPQGGGQEDQMQQLVQMAEQALAQGASPEEVAQMLIQQGVPEQVVQQVIQYAIQDLQQQQQAQGQNPEEEAQEQMQQQNPQEEQTEMGYGGMSMYDDGGMAMYGNGGGIDNPGFRALPAYVQQDIINNMRTGGKFLRKAVNGIYDDNQPYTPEDATNTNSGMVNNTKAYDPNANNYNWNATPNQFSKSTGLVNKPNISKPLPSSLNININPKPQTLPSSGRPFDIGLKDNSFNERYNSQNILSGKSDLLSTHQKPNNNNNKDLYNYSGYNVGGSGYFNRGINHLNNAANSFIEGSQNKRYGGLHRMDIGGLDLDNTNSAPGGSTGGGSTGGGSTGGGSIGGGSIGTNNIGGINISSIGSAPGGSTIGNGTSIGGGVGTSYPSQKPNGMYKWAAGIGKAFSDNNVDYGIGAYETTKGIEDLSKGTVEIFGNNISNRNALQDEANNLRSAMRNDYQRTGKRPTDGNAIISKYGGRMMEDGGKPSLKNQILNTRLPATNRPTLNPNFNRSTSTTSPLSLQALGKQDYGVSLNKNGLNLSAGLNLEGKNPAFRAGVDYGKGNWSGSANYSTDNNNFGTQVGYNNKGFNAGAGYQRNNDNNSFNTNAGYSNNGFNVGAGYQRNNNNNSFNANVGYDGDSPVNFNANYAYDKDHSFDTNVGLNLGRFSGGLNYGYNQEGDRAHNFGANANLGLGKNLNVNADANFDSNKNYQVNAGLKYNFQDGGATYADKMKVSKNSPQADFIAEKGEYIVNNGVASKLETGGSHASGNDTAISLDKSSNPSYVLSDTPRLKQLQFGGKRVSPSKYAEMATVEALGKTPDQILKAYTAFTKRAGTEGKVFGDRISDATNQLLAQKYQKDLATVKQIADQAYHKQEQLKHAMGMDNDLDHAQEVNGMSMAKSGGMQDGVHMNYFNAPAVQYGGRPQLFSSPSRLGYNTTQMAYGGLPKMQTAGNADNTGYDPEFLEGINFMADAEQAGSSQGPQGYVGGGSNWGTNNPNIKSKEEAIKHYNDNYWPMVKDLPSGLRTRALQMAINTGDPYGELMVAGNNFKSTAPNGDIFTNDKRYATRNERKDLAPDKFTGNDWKDRQNAIIGAYNENPNAFMENLDIEQNRYYNEGLNYGQDSPEVKKFHNDYYQGAGNIANKYISSPQTNPLNINTNMISRSPFNAVTNTNPSLGTAPMANTNSAMAVTGANPINNPAPGIALSTVSTNNVTASNPSVGATTAAPATNTTTAATAAPATNANTSTTTTTATPTGTKTTTAINNDKLGIYNKKAFKEGNIDYNEMNKAGNDLWTDANYKTQWIPKVDNAFAIPENQKILIDRLENYSGQDANDVKLALSKGKTFEEKVAIAKRLATDGKPGPYHSIINELIDDLPKEPVKTPTAEVKKETPPEVKGDEPKVPDLSIDKEEEEPYYDFPAINAFIPQPYGRNPIGLAQAQPQTIRPAKLNIQPELNEYNRSMRGAFRGTQGNTSVNVAQQMQGLNNLYGAQNKLYGQKYNFDEQSRMGAEQFNAQAIMNTDAGNLQRIGVQQDLINRREGALDTQRRKDFEKGIEIADKQNAYGLSKEYIEDTFAPYLNNQGKLNFTYDPRTGEKINKDKEKSYTKSELDKMTVAERKAIGFNFKYGGPVKKIKLKLRK